jgi:hypothetical protein
MNDNDDDYVGSLHCCAGWNRPSDSDSTAATTPRRDWAGEFAMKEWIAIFLWAVTRQRNIAVKMIGEARVKEIETSEGMFG